MARVKLEGAGIFKSMAIDPAGLAVAEAAFTPLNLLAYDGAGRIFMWDLERRLLHSLQIEDSTLDDQSESLYAASESKTLKLSTDVSFAVRSLKLNRTGELLLLAGERALMFVSVVSQASQPCRSGMIAGDMFNGRSLRVLHAAWHPYSETHLGVLSSDGVFRLYNLAGDITVPEQEYHLQIGARSKPYCRAVSFAFGGEHFWDRFTVFVLLTDASIYALCPIVPFGSLHYGSSLKDLAGQVSNNSPTAKESSRLAAVWLEIVFPELGDAEKELETSSVFRARPQVPFNASLVLQGPLPKLSGRENDHKISSYATGMLYNTAGKDSVITVCTKNGEMFFYAIADEVHPMWSLDNNPKLLQDDLGDLVTLAMLVEPSAEKDDAAQTADEDTEEKEEEQFIGPNPPLLHLASVDLALDTEVYNASPLGIFSDPLVPERIYCHHAMGLDTIQLQWLPFSDTFSGESREPPIVFPVLETSASGNSAPVPLLGATVILQSSGDTWLVVLTASGNCAVVHMKPHRPLPPVAIEDTSIPATNSDQPSLKLISSDLLLGPKDIHIPLISASTPLTLNTVEGRSILHDQGKLLHEKYIEYAHRVHVELKSHHKYLGHVVQDLQRQLRQVTGELDQAQSNLDSFVTRIQRAFEKNVQLQERIRECNKLPALKQKVLTVAEREFKDLLDRKMNQDVDILQSAVESLTLRAERVAKKKVGLNSAGRRNSPKLAVPDSKMRTMRQALDKLGQYIELSSRRIDILDQTVKRKESQLES
ncbi:nuclear pore complex protein NUP88-like isoform X1 [Selaginella moellendorffii]|uniref:nuclear pore complex protein NUP88-like isoform X1 n=2 Tax=Selaginella moellendorffii TaxID=88036 RepID=UPI000D1C3FD1|nr:nuclear pore complex protein NUP88-like isoform X1 [Selaginella moellendorffii]|eukprot:XP_024531584.1 nuclear pore complex protein NUP88-like isoform X1 [Selaginella moellendorffii]